jgi:hypothetical protein
MSIEEALEHDLVASLLEDTIDNGQLVPGAKGWRQHQTELVEDYLSNPDESGTAPLARIHAARREAWLELPGRNAAERNLLERALANTDNNLPSPVESEEAIEPLLWLLEQLANGAKLTQTGALPRALVRAAVERYPDWWNSSVGPPYQEAELYQLCVLHDLIDALKLVRRQRVILQLTPKGRVLRADPPRLLREVAATLAPELPAEFDLSLAQLVFDDKPDEIDWPLHGLLTPFHGITVENHLPTAVTRGGCTLAAAILNARARGPRTTLS